MMQDRDVASPHSSPMAKMTVETRRGGIIDETGGLARPLSSHRAGLFSCPRSDPSRGVPVVARPLPTSNATVSTIFRVIEMARPTLLIDEADTFLRENDELRGIINSGHRKGGADPSHVERCKQFTKTARQTFRSRHQWKSARPSEGGVQQAHARRNRSG
jgi:hypothetical protein